MIIVAHSIYNSRKEWYYFVDQMGTGHVWWSAYICDSFLSGSISAFMNTIIIQPEDREIRNKQAKHKKSMGAFYIKCNKEDETAIYTKLRLSSLNIILTK